MLVFHVSVFFALYVASSNALGVQNLLSLVSQRPEITGPHATGADHQGSAARLRQGCADQRGPAGSAGQQPVIQKKMFSLSKHLALGDGSIAGSVQLHWNALSGLASLLAVDAGHPLLPL